MPTALDGAHLYEQVADRLEQQILSHPDTVGTKLPSEQELAHGFSVSRPVVREALKLEPGLIPLALLSLGYPAELPEPSSRRRLDEVVAWR